MLETEFSKSQKLNSHQVSYSEKLHSHDSKYGEGMESQRRTLQDDPEGALDGEDSPTDSDMDEVIKTAALDKKTKKVAHRANKDWTQKINAKLMNTGMADEIAQARVASNQGKR